MTFRLPYTTAWASLLVCALLIEAQAIARHHPSGTLSEQIRHSLRYTPLKWAFVPFMFWIFWHFVIRSYHVNEFTWRDLLAVGLGMLWCVVESLLGYGPSG